MLLEEFKRLVDKFPPTLYSNNLEEAYDVLKLDRKCFLTDSEVTNKIYSIISHSISLKERKKENDLKRQEFVNLRAELIYRYVLYNENPSEYLKILSVINDSCRKDCNYFANFNEDKKWGNAITNCKNYNNYRPATFSVKLYELRKHYPKEYDIATSAKILTQYGCEIDIKNTGIEIVSGLEEVINKLEKTIKKIGGLTVIKLIFKYLTDSNKFSTRFERFFMIRETNGVGYNQKPQIPFGYIINLSLKYPYESQIKSDLKPFIDEIIKLSTIITNGAYGVQQYSIWSTHFHTGDTIIKHCIDTALWDSIFNFQQSRPSNAIETSKKLFNFINDSEFENSIGFSKKDFFDLINFINQFNTSAYKIITIHTSFIQSKLKGIEKIKIQKILNFLSHSNQVNKDFKSPSDYIHIDFFLKPLIKLENKKFILINKSYCSPNYFEALATHFREDFKKSKKNLDKDLGIQLEIFLQDKLKEKGIKYYTGEYKVDGISGECDLLIESKKTIILIEFKKKPLTRKAKSGIDINILLDLVESVLNAQVQAGRTEIILKEKGNICLKNKNGEENIISLNDRSIERIALTQLEFGGFQDRIFISQFLKSLLTHSFNTNSTDYIIIDKFQKFAEKQRNLLEQHNKLIEIDELYKNNPFFNCWFLGLPQLLEIIHLSNDNDSFFKVLTNTKYITMGTFDWYFEFNYTNNLNNLDIKQIK